MYPLQQGEDSSIRVDSDLSNEDKVGRTQLKEESKAQEKVFEVEESIRGSTVSSFLRRLVVGIEVR